MTKHFSKTLLSFSIFVLALAPTLSSADLVSDFAHRHTWQLSGGQGEWQKDASTGEMCLTVSGSGEDHESNYWFCAYPFQAQGIYKVTANFLQIQIAGIVKGTFIANQIYCFRYAL